MKKVLLPTLLACLTLASAAFAQGPPQPPPGGPAGPPPEIVLREFLSLTDEQAVTFQTLLESREQAIRAILPQLDEAERALGEALKSPSPDPIQLGNLLLAAHGFREQIRLAEETMAAGFKNLLSQDQQAKVARVLELERVLPVLGAMRMLHLLPPPAEGTGRRGSTPAFPPTAPAPTHTM